MMNNKTNGKIINEYINNKELLFGSFYIDWLEQELHNFTERVSAYSFYSESVCKNFIEILYGKLSTITLRILIEEMHICKEQNLLNGKDSTEEYQYYNKVLLNDEIYKESILKKYPLLKHCMDDASRNVTENMVFLMVRFDKDLERIEKEIFHKKIKYITGFKSNFSDAHNKGNCVVKIEVDNEDYLIYKPHSVENEMVFHELSQFLGKWISLDFYIPKIICCDGYGWEEFVESQPCQSEEEVGRFYQRIGILLFLAYILKTTDLHQENLIAHGEYPVFVDMETLFGISRVSESGNIYMKIREFMQESVINTGILPFYHWNAQNQGINVSALSSVEVQILPVRIPTVVDIYTSDMRIIYDYGKVHPSKNQVKLQREKVVPEDYVQDVIWGFQKIYEIALENKKEFLKQFQTLESLCSRYLISDTQKYSMMLTTSYHPDLMKEPKKRDQIFQMLWNSKKKKQKYDGVIHDCETMDLRQGDVPTFFIRFDSRSLYFHGEAIIDNYLMEKPQKYLEKTVSLLSEKDKMHQIMLIETSMSIPDNLISKDRKISGNQILKNKCIDRAVLKHCIDRILEFALFTSDGKEIGWVTPRIVGKRDSRFQMQVSGMYLYDGLAGMLLLFAQIIHKWKYIEYKEIYDKLKQQLRTYTYSVQNNIESSMSGNTGIFNGESSIIAAYLMLYKITDETEHLEMAQRHAEVVYNLLESDENCDLLDGKAGAILIFLELYKISKDRKYLDWAHHAEELLFANAFVLCDEIAWKHKETNVPLLGMAHGNAGISLAYGKLYEATKEGCYLDKLEKILSYESRRYNENAEDWYDYRKNDEDSEVCDEPAAWCHGAGGILSARLELKKLDLPESIQQIINLDIQKAIKKVKKSYMRNSLCLCHGLSGNLMILKKYISFYADDEAETIYQKGYNYVYDCLKNNCMELIREKYGMGLMTGYGGILYFLLLSDKM